MDFGFSDAANYKRRVNKELFQQFFVQNEYLDALLSPNTTFLIGEKGTGKTAYGPFLEPLASGAINTTNVIGSGDAVHSWHVVFGTDDLFHSQYYGTYAR